MSAVEQTVTAPWTYPCDDPKCPYLNADPNKDNSRPYSGSGMVSVTGAVGVQDKGDPFAWAASKIASTYWANHASELMRMERDEAIERGRKAFKGEWAGSALVGSLTHECGEAFLHGNAWDIPAEFRGKPVPDDVADRMPGFVEGLYRFFNDCAPTAICTEQTIHGVAGGIEYTGTFDWVVWIDGVCWLLDLKTGKPRDTLYTNENRLQLAAYRYADLAHWHRRTLISTMPWADALPLVEKTGIVKMTGQGDYELYEVDTSPELMDEFAACCRVHRWMNKDHKTPAPVIVSEYHDEPELIAYAPRPDAPVSLEAML